VSPKIAIVCCEEGGPTFRFPDEVQINQPDARLKSMNRPRDLNAVSATIILLAYLAAEVFWVACAGVIAFAIARQQGAGNDYIFRLLDKLMPALLVLSPLSGGIATVLMTFFLVPKCAKDTSRNGAAWVPGSWMAITEGFLLGLIVGAGAILMIKTTRHHVDYRDIDPLARMALSSGFLRALAVIIALLLAPPTEEILFRGVLLGGYRKSFGSFWAALLTTFLLLLLHVPKTIHSMPILAGLTGVSAAALWCRWRSSAIGPAIAVHVGYNALLTVIAFLPRFR
jgi:membrane protease YdiL (CAAX protease family)